MANRGQFKKGVSGNPGGKRKTEIEFQQEAQKHGARALSILVEIMEGKSAFPSDRIAACKLVLAYAYGNPRQININGAPSDFEPPSLQFVVPEGEAEEAPFPEMPGVPESEAH